MTALRLSVPILELTDLRVRNRAGEMLLDGVSFDVAPGECVALVGESGAGKTLLARSLLGLIDPPLEVDRKRWRLRGESVSASDPRLRRVCSYVHQNALASLDPLMRVEHQVGEALRLRGVRDRRTPVQNALDAAGLTPDRALLRAFPHELSGGMRQRVLIASALVSRPEVLVADEPTTALDTLAQNRVLETISTIVRRGTASILISHDLAAVAQVADRVLVLENGRIVESGATKDILLYPQHPTTQELVRASDYTVVRQENSAATQNSREPLQVRNPLVAVRDLTVEYRGSSKPALQNARFELSARETLGVIGESGSGKSTLAHTLLGLIHPISGEMRLPRESVQWIPQDPHASFTRGVTVKGAMVEAIRVAQHKKSDPALVSKRDVKKRPGQLRERVFELLGQVHLERRLLNQRVERLSGGQAQRLAIARALAVNPQVLICDEPLSALDSTVRLSIISLLEHEQRKRGFAMVYISHELKSVARLADSVLILRDGETVEQGRTSSVFDHPKTAYAARLLSTGVMG
jgi:peptide/nickel transport system ATP-binding protein